jgi:hypothetical protein
MKVRLLTLLLLLTAAATAQTFRGTILGTVTDATGAVVSGAQVTVHNANTGLERITLTSADGAGEHTHAGALGQAHPVMFDWLDTTLTR